MAAETKPLIITFGGGINARKRALDIDVQECRAGENFALDPLRNAFNRRAAFDLKATTPNAASILGYAQLRTKAGVITTLIQSGTNVYSWDGDTTFALVGTVSSTSVKLRGGLDQNFTLDDYTIITDLSKTDPVKMWDGTTFQNFTHNLGGTFIAKYCRVFGERSWFANVTSGGTSTPHVVLGSKLSDGDNLSTANLPSSALGYDQPFYLVMPDLRPINGMEQAFGEFLFSTERGRLWKLSGSSAFDFALAAFFQGSSVSGNEAIINIGNDVLLGLEGRIESLAGTMDFGDVETNDISTMIAPLIDDVTEWTFGYDQRLQRVYCFPAEQAACYVLYKSLLYRVQHGFLADDNQAKLSPWSKFTTEHAMGFQPQTVMTMINPVTGTDAVYAGDTNGKIYLLEGDGDQDGGTTDITAYRVSKILALPPGDVFDVEGWILYAAGFATTLTITFEYQGIGLFDQAITIPLSASSSQAAYSGDYYYSGSVYYSAGFNSRLTRRNFAAAGQADLVQIRCSVSGDEVFDLHEVGIKFRAATAP